MIVNRELPLLQKPLEVPDSEISCANCNGACCRKGVWMHLIDDEAAFLRSAGTILYENPDLKYSLRSRAGRLLGAIAGRAFKGEYRLDSDCGHLSDNKCMAYGDDGRPKVCGAFRVGSAVCKYFRIQQAVQEGPSLEPLGNYLTNVTTIVESTAD